MIVAIVLALVLIAWSDGPPERRVLVATLAA